MKKIKTELWNIDDDLTTEDDIRLFVEASVDEARNDTDPGYLAAALDTAAKARRRLAAQQSGAASRASAVQPEYALDAGSSISDFDKTARLFGYHITLAPVG